MGPLAGKRILVTRAAAQADSYFQALRMAGATPIAFPCIEIIPPDATGELALAISGLASNKFDWLILTSQNALQSFEGMTLLPTRLKIGSVGPETASAFEDRFGRQPDFIGRGGTGSDLAREVPIVAGESILLPKSAMASPEVGEILRRRGALVTEVVAYQTRTPTTSPDPIPDLNSINAITFASGSAVRGFRELTAGSCFSPGDLQVLCIGSSTAEVARTLGFGNIHVAALPSPSSLIESLESMFINHPVFQETTK
jgi:uroporphyrinogen-III synthase